MVASRARITPCVISIETMFAAAAACAASIFFQIDWPVVDGAPELHAFVDDAHDHLVVFGEAHPRRRRGRKHAAWHMARSGQRAVVMVRRLTASAEPVLASAPSVRWTREKR